MDQGKVELYDLLEDPGEAHVLSAELPEVVAQMEVLLAKLKEGKRDYVGASKALGYVE